MSVKSALQFIEYVRANPIQAELREHPPALEDFPAIGRTAGYDFTLDELRAAFRHDWGLRWLKANNPLKR